MDNRKNAQVLSPNEVHDYWKDRISHEQVAVVRKPIAAPDSRILVHTPVQFSRTPTQQTGRSSVAEDPEVIPRSGFPGYRQNENIEAFRRIHLQNRSPRRSEVMAGDREASNFTDLRARITQKLKQYETQ